MATTDCSPKVTAARASWNDLSGHFELADGFTRLLFVRALAFEPAPERVSEALVALPAVGDLAAFAPADVFVAFDVLEAFDALETFEARETFGDAVDRTRPLRVAFDGRDTLAVSSSVCPGKIIGLRRPLIRISRSDEVEYLLAMPRIVSPRRTV